MAIIPIPSTRTSDLLVSQRLLSQMRTDQLDLLRLQTQLSSGRRIFSPSDDAPAAQRAIVLQRLLEQKTQINVNLSTSQSYLAATDSSLTSVATLLSDIRGLAVTAADSTISDTERQAMSAQIMRAIDQLHAISNQQFRGRYLFGGSRTTAAPFENRDGYFVYHGNESQLRSFADLDLLVGTNVNGNTVFGAISPQIEGSVDFNPVLTLDTKLSNLRGGQGLEKGSFSISDGATSRTVDISSAETIGDVVRLIESNPPAGREITVRLTNNALVLQLDAAGGNLNIREVGGGKTAAQLGILNVAGVGTAPLVGSDLNPTLQLTTQLRDTLGVRASTLITSPGVNNDIRLEMVSAGAAGNGMTVQFVNDALLQAAPGVTAGNEIATFSDVPVAARAALRLPGADNDLILTANQTGTTLNNVRVDITTAAIGDAANVSFAAGVLTIQIDSAGQTSVDALQSALALEGTFSASYDTSLEAGVNGAATISATAAGTNVANTGNSGGAANTLFVRINPGQSSAQQVVSAINNSPGVGNLFRASLDGKDYTGGTFGSQPVSLNSTAVTSGGSGVEFDKTSGIQITNGGETFVIDLQTAQTVEEMLNIINGSPANVIAEINASQTGINIRSRLSGADFAIGENGGQTAAQLGIRSFTAETALSELNHGIGVEPGMTGDFTIRRSDGVELEISLQSAQTIGDVINLINNHVDNQNPATRVVAQLATFGNGLELVEATPTSGGTLAIAANPMSTAARALGLVPAGATEITATTTSGGAQVLTGRDVNPLETKGVFNTLIRLNEALLAGDYTQIERAVNMLDNDLNRLTFARADVGARQQNLDVLGNRLQDEDVELRSALSLEIDADVLEAISDLTIRQAAFQASLQTAANTFRMTLLDFL